MARLPNLRMRCADLKVHNCAKQLSPLFHTLFSLFPPMRMDLLLPQSNSEVVVVVVVGGGGGCLYGKRL